MTERTVCVLALGANLGNRLGNLQDALRRLARVVADVRVSALYESEPVGPGTQARYLNAVCRGATALDPAALLAAVKQIEWAIGRRPAPRWSARPIDIDVLLFGDRRIDTTELVLPHPRIAERAFVLWPLAELVPEQRLGGGRTARQLADAIGSDGLTRRAGTEWPTLATVTPVGSRPAAAHL